MGRAQIFKAVKLFCMVLQSWINDITHLSKIIEYTTQRVTLNVNYELQLIMHQYWFISCNKVPH